jgi:hypothetical protein
MSDYPATIEVDSPERLENWRPLAQWLLAIPHLIISNVLDNLARVVAVVSWFAIVFTGRLPAGLANLQCMAIRYSARALTYAGFLHSSYPPFDFSMTPADPGGMPVRVNIRPELEDRNRLTVGLRIIWLIPALLFAALIAIVGIVCWFLAFWAVLFTGRWPEALRSWVMKLQRVGIRVSAYAYLLTDEFPPFTTD